jgi:hypothetical protein
VWDCFFRAKERHDFLNVWTPDARLLMKVLFFLSLFLIALCLAPAMAHGLELLNKIDLPAEEYLVVQKIYRGWALYALIIFPALIATIILVFRLRKQKPVFWLAFIGLICMLITQVIFWTFTFPANRQTKNWTILPDNWELLRKDWEYSHTVGAVFWIIAFALMLGACLTYFGSGTKEHI